VASVCNGQNGYNVHIHQQVDTFGYNVHTHQQVGTSRYSVALHLFYEALLGKSKQQTSTSWLSLKIIMLIWGSPIPSPQESILCDSTYIWQSLPVLREWGQTVREHKGAPGIGVMFLISFLDCNAGFTVYDHIKNLLKCVLQNVQCTVCQLYYRAVKVIFWKFVCYHWARQGSLVLNII
jgi:hypothetical protein